MNLWNKSFLSVKLLIVGTFRPRKILRDRLADGTLELIENNQTKLKKMKVKNLTIFMSFL